MCKTHNGSRGTVCRREEIRWVQLCLASCLMLETVNPWLQFMLPHRSGNHQPSPSLVMVTRPALRLSMLCLAVSPALASLSLPDSHSCPLPACCSVAGVGRRTQASGRVLNVASRSCTSPSLSSRSKAAQQLYQSCTKTSGRPGRACRAGLQRKLDGGWAELPMHPEH